MKDQPLWVAVAAYLITVRQWNLGGEAVVGAVIGCIVGLPGLVVGCLPGMVTGAGIGGVAGTILAGGGTAVVAGLDLIKVLNAPAGTTLFQ